MRLVRDRHFSETGDEHEGRPGDTASPPPADEARVRAALLIEHMGFTPDEAARFVAGDRTAIEAVAARRLAAGERDADVAESF